VSPVVLACGGCFSASVSRATVSKCVGAQTGADFVPDACADGRAERDETRKKLEMDGSDRDVIPSNVLILSGQGTSVQRLTNVEAGADPLIAADRGRGNPGFADAAGN
jgi:hypothetical protein